MGYGIMLSADNVDFMVHGVFQYSFFGHPVWITTTHICLLIIMIVLIGFAIVVNRTMKKATEVPHGLQNVVEMLVDLLDGMVKVRWESMQRHSEIISEQSLHSSWYVTCPACWAYVHRPQTMV